MEMAGRVFQARPFMDYPAPLEFGFNSPAIHGREGRKRTPLAAARAGAGRSEGELPGSPALKRRAIESGNPFIIRRSVGLSKNTLPVYIFC